MLYNVSLSSVSLLIPKNECFQKRYAPYKSLLISICLGTLYVLLQQSSPTMDAKYIGKLGLITMSNPFWTNILLTAVN